MKSPILTYHHFSSTLCFLVCLILLSCGAKKTNVVENTIPINHPKLLFLNYVLEKNSNGQKTMTLKNKFVTDGKLKNTNNKFTKEPSEGDLKCIQVDDHASELHSVFIKNPLFLTIEVPNDSLSFEKRLVEQNRANVSLKLQLHPKTKHIVISEVNALSEASVQLIKIELE
ncbi:hypothetical protein KFZ70_07740 [Tamlana fucoidanivorans]|uniref:Lipoprotein n=1 Tax=Allotamlana fucoidanivorans TaxID=2583814 RepID=A0A5C4SJ41_9FLAO|nr:hypothetical protein [Tamlana fucoidanivorans]TNJ43782.1 hypothetical protein FGF67_10455 [Tamlana fucoidanivorans]